jgi:hypothetical protein
MSMLDNEAELTDSDIQARIDQKNSFNALL